MLQSHWTYPYPTILGFFFSAWRIKSPQISIHFAFEALYTLYGFSYVLEKGYWHEGWGYLGRSQNVKHFQDQVVEWFGWDRGAIWCNIIEREYSKCIENAMFWIIIKHGQAPGPPDVHKKTWKWNSLAIYELFLCILVLHLSLLLNYIYFLFHSKFCIGLKNWNYCANWFFLFE